MILVSAVQAVIWTLTNRHLFRHVESKHACRYIYLIVGCLLAVGYLLKIDHLTVETSILSLQISDVLAELLLEEVRLTAILPRILFLVISQEWTLQDRISVTLSTLIHVRTVDTHVPLCNLLNAIMVVIVIVFRPGMCLCILFLVDDNGFHKRFQMLHKEKIVYHKKLRDLTVKEQLFESKSERIRQALQKQRSGLELRDRMIHDLIHNRPQIDLE